MQLFNYMVHDAGIELRDDQVFNEEEDCNCITEQLSAMSIQSVSNYPTDFDMS